MNKIGFLFVFLSMTAWAEPRRIDLPTLLSRARTSPQARVAREAANVARAKADEVGHAWMPRLEITAVGGPSPEIRCMPSAEQCTSTSPTEAGLRFSGLFFRVDVQAGMPLYTFGKLAAGRDAAAAGARAADDLAAVAAGDAVVDAARAYYGVKLAREIILMLKEGRDDVDDAIAKVEKDLDKGKGEVTEADRHRLKAFRAEIDTRLSEAEKGERIALAGLRLLYGAEDVDVDDQPLAAVEGEPGEAAAARAGALARRPERRAAQEGVRAAEKLHALELRRWLPDFLAVAQATLARAGGADDPSNAFANDPFNVSSVSAGVALRWSLDFGAQPAKVRGAAADEARARAVADLAAAGVAADAEKTWAEALDARTRLQASRQGEKEARAWLVTTLQATTAGLAEPKDLADALLAWFNMRAHVLQSTFDWNVATIALRRATGQLEP